MNRLSQIAVVIFIFRDSDKVFGATGSSSVREHSRTEIGTLKNGNVSPTRNTESAHLAYETDRCPGALKLRTLLKSFDNES